MRRLCQLPSKSESLTLSRPSIEFIEASLIDALLLRSTSYNAFSVAKVTPISAVFDPLTNSFSRQ